MVWGPGEYKFTDFVYIGSVMTLIVAAMKGNTEIAAMLIANNDDMMNTDIAFTIREISEKVPVMTNADADDSIDVLQLAGSTHVFQFMKMLGESLARRTLGVSMGANVIGRFDQLLIAETPAI